MKYTYINIYQKIYMTVCCRMMQCVAVCCSVSTYCFFLQSVAVCCSMLQCVAVCCSKLQCVAVYHHTVSTCLSNCIGQCCCCCCVVFWICIPQYVSIVCWIHKRIYIYICICTYIAYTNTKWCVSYVYILCIILESLLTIATLYVLSYRHMYIRIPTHIHNTWVPKMTCCSCIFFIQSMSAVCTINTSNTPCQTKMQLQQQHFFFGWELVSSVCYTYL